MEATTRPCLACGKPVKGRIDKKFCDDYCRNVYNNQLKLDENAFVRQVTTILKKNRRILSELLGNEGMIKQPKSKTIEYGFPCLNIIRMST
jgi:predicted nucleic acid-binding Zn ribbon protein